MAVAEEGALVTAAKLSRRAMWKPRLLGDFPAVETGFTFRATKDCHQYFSDGES